MFVVATAGHVDHGKSTLIRALTGMEPDRLDEEHRRGLSIELGFAWTTWPDIGEVAFVDVPGHRRFLRTTLAGLGPVPVVLLVVAADEGWMPQSAEHLAALDALGVCHGVLVITKIDLADPVGASADARRALAPTLLADVPEVRICALDGSGVAELVETLARVLAQLPEPDATAPPRLWVDRSFSVAGAGRVITGTLPSGTVKIGAELTTVSGLGVRVRGIETLGRPVPEISGTARVALNVRLLDRGGELERGQALIIAGGYATTTVLDAALRTTVGRPPSTAVLHIGSAAMPCRVRSLADRHVRLTLANPLPLHVGDRALLRDPARPGALVGLTVLDVRPPVLTGRGAAGRRAAVLASVHTPADAARHVLSRGAVRTGDLAAMGLPPDDGVEASPGWLIGNDRWAELGLEFQKLRAADAAGDPLGRPRTAASVADALDLPDPALASALITETEMIMESGPLLPSAVRAAVDRLDEWFGHHPFAAPTVDQLRGLGLDDASLAAAARAGRLLRLAPNVVLADGADEAAAERLGAVPSPFRVTDACAALAATRRTVVPLLEHLDRLGRTRQVGAGRRVVVRTTTPPGRQ